MCYLLLALPIAYYTASILGVAYAFMQDDIACMLWALPMDLFMVMGPRMAGMFFLILPGLYYIGTHMVSIICQVDILITVCIIHY